ncbi:MAG: hypothetical protein KC416_08375, partial [Myxococcales bacterium]|nr:hypothetical protein [Myxococcales bacterium]
MAEVSLPIRELTRSAARKIAPGSFEPENHFYPRVLNAQVHPLVSFFMNMGRARIVERYCHLNPAVNPESLEKILSFAPRFFRWAGADLFCTTNAEGNRRMVLIETNSCPSGNKSMPLLSDDQEQGGYRTLMERMFYPLLKRRGLPEGALAVLYDKNFTEASGYAAALADLTGESVYLTPLPADAEDPPARFRDRQL